MDLVEKIRKFEAGSMSEDETVEFIGKLMRTDMILSMREDYLQMAEQFVEKEYLDRDGGVLKLPSYG